MKGVQSRGELNVLLIPLIFVVLVLLGAMGFGIWAFTSREDYRTNTEAKIAVAVKDAKVEEGIVKDKEHAEANKQPLKPYKSPEAYGSVVVNYPKTWSAYILDDLGAGSNLEAYFSPTVVPNVTGKSSVFSLRIKVVNQSYAKVISAMQSQVKTKKVTAEPYAFPKVPKVVGTRFEGAIISGKPLTGTMVVVPIRDKTLQVWTESPLNSADFNNYILPNLSFSP